MGVRADTGSVDYMLGLVADDPVPRGRQSSLDAGPRLPQRAR